MKGIRAEGPKPGGMLETIYGFLRKEEMGNAPPIRSVGGRLESYGVTIAKWEGDTIVVYPLKPEDDTPVRQKHRRYVELMAKESNVNVTRKEG